MKRLVLLLAALTGCASINPKLDPDIEYRRDLELTINGMSGTGAVVVPRASSYRVKIASPGNISSLAFETCHRSITAMPDERTYEMLYMPNVGIEDRGGCPIKIETYDAKKGQHSWGFVEFESPEATVPAIVKCNGDMTTFKGVSVCQSRETLVQKITFDRVMKVRIGTGCADLRTNDSMNFEFPIATGECKYTFYEAFGNGIHRLIAIGYKSVAPRGGT